ncbi:MAG: isopenicillin N synthase family oxygenase [Candidatus Protistobacter heckmanni]|nr:isopenicillin N synthase family oxygenase [Candidatus Protistobacter heckmanni]
MAAQLHANAQKCGFFYIANHGIPDGLMASMLDLAERFFKLPAPVRMQVEIGKSTCRRGYEPMQYQTLDLGSPPDLKESFFIGEDFGPEHPYVKAGLPNYGANQWLSDEDCGMPEFRPTLERYFRMTRALAEEMMRMFAMAVDMPADHFDPAMVDPMGMLRLIHYPPQPGDTEFNQLGCGAHTDWGAFTLLLQDDAGGLEVCDAAGRWITAAPIPGTLLINLGDMMPRWTNGLYHSNLHRVKNKNPHRHRYSIPYFYDPNFYAKVECLPTMLGAGETPLFAPCTVGEHIDEMYKKTFVVEATA